MAAVTVLFEEKLISYSNKRDQSMKWNIDHATFDHISSQ